MDDLTHEQRCERLDTMIAEGRLLRKEWAGTDAKGRETACLLAALSPEVAAVTDACACPASVMPVWLAYLTPDIDDYVSDGAWPEIVRRYAALAHRWHVLTDEQWKRLDYRCRAIAVREALSHAPMGDHVPAVVRVLELLDAAGRGDLVTGQQWDAATVAASPAARNAARNAALAAARNAARNAALAAALAAARAAARNAAWDRMATAMLDAIEAEIGGA